MTASSDLIRRARRSSTLGRSNPIASAVGVMDGTFATMDGSGDLTELAEPPMRVIDPKGARVWPGLIDNNLARCGGSLVAAPPPPPALPDCSPERPSRGYGAWRDTPREIRPSAAQGTFAAHGVWRHARLVHGGDHATVWSGPLPIADLPSFLGFLDRSCWAI